MGKTEGRIVEAGESTATLRNVGSVAVVDELEAHDTQSSSTAPRFRSLFPGSRSSALSAYNAN